MSDNVKTFDVELCFRESLEAYRRNILIFIIASLTVSVLGFITIFILMGPLLAGFMMMILCSMREEVTPKFDDLLKYFHRFGTLFLGFFIPVICSFIGLIFLIVPGLLIFTVWMYVLLFITDKGMGIWDALRASFNLVVNNNIWKHLILFIIAFAIQSIAAAPQGPFGVILCVLAAPLTIGLIVSAYRQLMEKESVEIKEEVPPKEEKTETKPQEEKPSKKESEERPPEKREPPVQQGEE